MSQPPVLMIEYPSPAHMDEYRRRFAEEIRRLGSEGIFYMSDGSEERFDLVALYGKYSVRRALYWRRKTNRRRALDARGRR